MAFDKKWSDNAAEQMEFLGNFAPTVRPEAKEVKGYMLDKDGDGVRVYLEPGYLRLIASACNEVAEWLEERAASDLR